IQFGMSNAFLPERLAMEMPATEGPIARGIWHRANCCLAFRAALTFVILITPILCARLLAAQETAGVDSLTERDLHVWGRFSPGTGKSVRIVTESLNARGEPVGITTTDTKTTLLQVSPRSLSLRVDITVVQDGQQFARQSRVIEHGF